MADKSFPWITSAVLGVMIVGLGTWTGLGIKSAVARAGDSAALAEIDSHEPKALIAVRESERARLESGPMPIERAMADMTAHGRLGVDAGIMPRPSNDVAPLQGWAFRQHDVPPWMLAEDAGAPDADGTTAVLPEGGPQSPH